MLVISESKAKDFGFSPAVFEGILFASESNFLQSLRSLNELCSFWLTEVQTCVHARVCAPDQNAEEGHEYVGGRQANQERRARKNSG